VKGKIFSIKLILLTLLLLFLDLFSKDLAERLLANKGVIPVLGDFFVLYFVRNRGAFLSLGNTLGQIGWFILFIFLPLLLLVVYTVYIYKNRLFSGSHLSATLLVLSGGLGNLVDRILFGSVRDFMNIGLGRIIRSGVFNLADLYIVIFVIILLFSLFSKKDGSAKVGEKTLKET